MKHQSRNHRIKKYQKNQEVYQKNQEVSIVSNGMKVSIMSYHSFILLTLLVSLYLGMISCQDEEMKNEPGECLKGWHRFGRKCFFVNMTVVHSKENEGLCSSLNSSMVTVNSEEENEFIRRLIFIHYESHKWIWLSRGRNYNSSSNRIQWSADEGVIDYTNWITPEGVDCNVCCEIALMTSGHWFPSHCNSWSFIQMCQLVLPHSDSPLHGEHSMDKETESAFSGNFYLSQFTRGRSDQVTHHSDDRDSNLTELFDWLFYELEGMRQDLNSLRNSSTGSLYEDALLSRDTYLLTLLSLTLSLLLIILVGVGISYFFLMQRLDAMDCLVRNWWQYPSLEVIRRQSLIRSN